jgi:hypothetical protein
MSRKVALYSLLLALTGSTGAFAQGKEKLALLIPNLFGPSGLVVNSQARLPDGSTHSAHFNSAFQAEFTQFNIALASQLATVPLPTPASGFTYTFDASLGVFQRSTQSFGPILAERAETIGRRKFTFGVTYQYFNFDTLEGVDLNAVPSVFTHDGADLGGGRSDVVTTSSSINATLNQTVAFFTYGLNDRIDLSLAVPFVSVYLGAASDARILRVGTAASPATHYFEDAAGGFGSEKVYSRSGRATGIGDLVVRLKGSAVRSSTTSIAFGLDARLPTGDEANFLGLGAPGLKPFAVLTLSAGRFSPHANLAYLWNGKSVLAGDVATGRKEDLPDQVLYAGGVDVGVFKRLTLAVDFLGQRVIDSPRLVQKTFTTANGQSLPQIGFVSESYSIANGAVGFKLNPAGKLLIDFNLLFSLNDSGLRDKVTPLFGIEYAF